VVECEYKALNSNPRYKKERLREKEKKEGKEKKRRRKEGRKEITAPSFKPCKVPLWV
jgi:hypothetical protein